jgi:hypothetical protein
MLLPGANTSSNILYSRLSVSQLLNSGFEVQQAGQTVVVSKNWTPRYEDANYAIALHWPGEQLAIRSLGTALPLWDGAVHNVHLLGHAGQLEWSHGESGLTVRMPDRKPCDHAFVLKIS